MRCNPLGRTCIGRRRRSGASGDRYPLATRQIRCQDVLVGGLTPNPIVSSRLPWRFSRELLSRKLSVLTGGRASRIAQQQPWSEDAGLITVDARSGGEDLSRAIFIFWSFDVHSDRFGGAEGAPTAAGSRPGRAAISCLARCSAPPSQSIRSPSPYFLLLT